MHQRALQSVQHATPSILRPSITAVYYKITQKWSQIMLQFSLKNHCNQSLILATNHITKNSAPQGHLSIWACASIFWSFLNVTKRRCFFFFFFKSLNFNMWISSTKRHTLSFLTDQLARCGRHDVVDGIYRLSEHCFKKHDTTDTQYLSSLYHHGQSLHSAAGGKFT